MYRYAQIDENGCVVSDSHLSGEVNYPNMIPISDDFDLSNKRWNGTEWETYEPTPIPEPPQSPTFEETVMSALADLYELILEGGE